MSQALSKASTKHILDQATPDIHTGNSPERELTNQNYKTREGPIQYLGLPSYSSGQAVSQALAEARGKG